MTDKMRIEKYTTNGKTFTAWGGEKPNGRNHWMVATDDHGSIEVVAEVVTQVERRKREDMSGRRAFRITTRTRCTVTFRVGYRKEFTMNGFDYLAGEKATLKQIMDLIAADCWPNWIANEMQVEAIRAGIDERRRWAASYPPSTDPMAPAWAIWLLLNDAGSESVKPLP